MKALIVGLTNKNTFLSFLHQKFINLYLNFMNYNIYNYLTSCSFILQRILLGSGFSEDDSLFCVLYKVNFLPKKNNEKLRKFLNTVAT